MKKPSVTDMQRAAEILVRRGVKNGAAQPLFYRALWWFGIPVRPPLYIPAIRSGAVSGIFMSISWGCLMRYSTWQSWSVLNITASCLFGFSMAMLIWWQSRRVIERFDLPEWSYLIQQAQEEQLAEQDVAPDS